MSLLFSNWMRVAMTGGSGNRVASVSFYWWFTGGAFVGSSSQI